MKHHNGPRQKVLASLLVLPAPPTETVPPLPPLHGMGGAEGGQPKASGGPVLYAISSYFKVTLLLRKL